MRPEFFKNLEKNIFIEFKKVHSKDGASFVCVHLN